MSKVIKFILPGIRHLNLSDAVALCSNGVVISIQLAFRIFDKSSSNSFDLRPVSSTKVILCDPLTVGFFHSDHHINENNQY
ncbi:hypothetical protein N9C00_03725 [Flavobacteriales bacterium]|nr:hypothetical protein [Flavobacteriales bacterium]